MTNASPTHTITLVIASGNPGKIKEIAALLEGVDVQIMPLDRMGRLAVPPESGDSFRENAGIKARAACQATGCVSLADDSGLEVDALGGLPGVRSARFGGSGKTDAERCALLLDNLTGVPPDRRTARFRCVVAIAEPAGSVHFAEGTCEGRIALAPRGSHGFGYDPVFEIPGLGLTLAEMDPREKNRLSHRARALTQARAILAEILRTRVRLPK